MNISNVVSRLYRIYDDISTLDGEEMVDYYADINDDDHFSSDFTIARYLNPEINKNPNLQKNVEDSGEDFDEIAELAKHVYDKISYVNNVYKKIDATVDDDDERARAKIDDERARDIDIYGESHNIYVNQSLRYL